MALLHAALPEEGVVITIATEGAVNDVGSCPSRCYQPASPDFAHVPTV